ncbi:MAG: hypothetical protein ACFFBP_18690 [Promethearchaeota archaeon]
MSSKDQSVAIKVRCPVCIASGQINIEKNKVTENERGITAVNITENTICEHSFITYIDNNLDIRDCYVCDFKIMLPQITVPELDDYDRLKNFDINLIKINLLPSVLANIIRVVLMGGKLLYISDQDFLNIHYLKFLEYIFGDTFNLDIIFLSRKEYKKSKKNYKNHVIIDGRKVINDDKRILENSKLKIEQVIVHQFYEEYDEVSGLILLKNEIYKIEKFIHQILKFHQTQKKGQQFRIKDAMLYLNNIFKITIQVPYLEFLLDIIENYFSTNLNRPTKVIDFFGLL